MNPGKVEWNEENKPQPDMELLEQCHKWNENDEYQKIIDTLEAIPAGERTPEMDSELARAYNNLAQPGDRELFEKAIALLEPHEEYFQGDHCWNFRIGYAYYYLDQESPALWYFEQALKARPGDEDTQFLIDDCRRRLSLPRFEKNFRERSRYHEQESRKGTSFPSQFPEGTQQARRYRRERPCPQLPAPCDRRGNYGNMQHGTEAGPFFSHF